jgi:hypothetical protein
LGVLDPITELKGEIASKSVEAVDRFNQGPTDPLTNWQRELSTFFGTFCDQLEAASRTLLKALDVRFDAISAVEQRLNGISFDFRRREEVMGLRVLEAIEAPFPPPSIIFQAVPEARLRYESLYSAFPPGTPFRDPAVDDFDPDGPLEDVDLVFRLEEGTTQRRFFAVPEDFFDAGGWQAIDPFAAAVEREPKTGPEEAPPDKKKLKTRAKELRRAKTVRILDRGGKRRSGVMVLVSGEDGADGADAPGTARRKSDKGSRPALARDAAAPESETSAADSSDSS